MTAPTLSKVKKTVSGSNRRWLVQGGGEKNPIPLIEAKRNVSIDDLAGSSAPDEEVDCQWNRVKLRVVEESNGTGSWWAVPVSKRALDVIVSALGGGGGVQSGTCSPVNGGGGGRGGGFAEKGRGRTAGGGGGTGGGSVRGTRGGAWWLVRLFVVVLCASMIVEGFDALPDLNPTTPGLRSILLYWADGGSKRDSVEKKYGPIQEWDLSQVTDMTQLFDRQSPSPWVPFPDFNADISQWNTMGIISMEKMFYGQNEFNSIVSAWDVSQVTTMAGMFHSAEKFNRGKKLLNTSSFV